MQVWLISCILFVFLALIEYFIVLFGIRYDKHWRTAKAITKTMASSIVNNETQVSVCGQSWQKMIRFCNVDAEFTSTKERFGTIDTSFPKFEQGHTGE